MSRRRLVISALPLVVLTAVGCGGVHGGVGVADKNVMAACDRAISRMRSAHFSEQADFGPYATASDLRAYARNQSVYAPIIESEVKALVRATSRTADEAKVAPLIKELRTVAGELRKGEAAAMADNRRGVLRAERTRQLAAAQVSAVATSKRLGRCAEATP